MVDGQHLALVPAPRHADQVPQLPVRQCPLRALPLLPVLDARPLRVLARHLADKVCLYTKRSAAPIATLLDVVRNGHIPIRCPCRAPLYWSTVGWYCRPLAVYDFLNRMISRRRRLERVARPGHAECGGTAPTRLPRDHAPLVRLAPADGNHLDAHHTVVVGGGRYWRWLQ